MTPKERQRLTDAKMDEIIEKLNFLIGLISDAMEDENE